MKSQGKKGQTTFQREKQGNVRKHKLNNKETKKLHSYVGKEPIALIGFSPVGAAKAIKQLLSHKLVSPAIGPVFS